MRRLTLIVLLILFAGYTNGQSFRLLRFDEDYSYLKDSARTRYEHIKYIPLDKHSDKYVSVGGSARIEYVDFNNEDWGRLNIGHNNFLLQRYDLHADFHYSNQIRVFAQLRSAWESGRVNGPRPIDEDKLNVQNLFADLQIIDKNEQRVTVRAGRQELDYGSGRLISVREGPNLRLYFDGVRLMYASGKLSMDLFAMKAATIHTAAFDNKDASGINLWGSYSRLIIPAAGNLDFYYLGINRNNARFEEGEGDELRHTIGARFWKYGGGFTYNFESAYQTGSFRNGRISAWTASADVGYVFGGAAGIPSINLRNDYISGDRNAGDGRLQTFNPLYPKGGYFGFSPQIGPVNLIDLHPYATISIGKKVVAQTDYVLNWRYSLNDGVYRPSGGFNLAGSASGKRFIGSALLVSFAVTASRFLSFNAGLQYFRTGSFINDIITTPHNGVFFNTRASFKF